MTEVSQRPRNLVICLCLILVTAGVYWPVHRFDFSYFDDTVYVVDNPHVQGGLTLKGLGWAFGTFLSGNWHPLTWLSHMLDWQLWGGNAGAHHLVNLLFHLANTVVLFCVLRRMTAALWRSAFVAGLFALHPLHVESVAWVAERKDVLSTFFWMLAVWAYVRYVEERNPSASAVRLHSPPAGQSVQLFSPRSAPNLFYGLALAFFALGLLSKPMVVTLPFVLLLLDYWPLGRTRWARTAAKEGVEIPLGQLLREKLPFFALAGVSCAVTYWAQRSEGAVTSLEKVSLGMRLANALLSYVSYLGKAVWPTGLTYFYPVDPNLSFAGAMIAGVGLVAVTVAVVRRARRDPLVTRSTRDEPWLATGWFWYLGMLVPVIGLVQVGSQSMADRYTYVPLVGLFIMLGWSVPNRMVERRVQKTAVASAAVALLVLYAVLCRIQVCYWENSEAMLRHAVQVTKNNWIAQNNLGLFLWQSGKVEEAIEHYDQAARLNPHSAEAHHNLGLVLSQVGRLPEAIQHFEQVVWIKPDSAEAHRRLGLALRQAGDLPEAARQFEQALRMKPDSAETHKDRGNASFRTGNLQDAAAHYEQSLRVDPNLVEVQNSLAWVLATLAPSEGGDPVRAVTLAQQACGRTDNQVAAYLDTMAVAYAAAGRFPDALATAQKAIDLARSAGQPELVAEIETRLQLYRDGRPYRQPMAASTQKESF